MKQELLPCPFCGITPKTLATHDDGCHALCCGDCDVNPSCSHETMEAAVKAWNTRAPDARVQLLAKALHQARAELACEGCAQEVEAIDAALKEAGITNEKVE